MLKKQEIIRIPAAQYYDRKTFTLGNVIVENWEELNTLKRLTHLYTSTEIFDISHIEELKNLVRLELITTWNNVTNKAKLGNLPNLTWLELFNTQAIDFNDIPNISTLRKLRLLSHNINNLKEIAKFKQLTDLDISYQEISFGNPSLFQIDLEHILNLNDLESLKIGEYEITNFAYLTKLLNLKNLAFWGTIIDFEEFPNLPKLESLTLAYIESAINWQKLRNLSNLNSLTIYSWENFILEPIPQLKTLKLNLGKEISVDCLAKLNEFSNLESLTIQFDNKISFDLKEISNLKKLKELKLNFAVINWETLKDLPNLKNLTIDKESLPAKYSDDPQPLITLEYNNFISTIAFLEKKNVTVNGISDEISKDIDLNNKESEKLNAERRNFYLKSVLYGIIGIALLWLTGRYINKSNIIPRLINDCTNVLKTGENRKTLEQATNKTIDVISKNMKF
ncbi:MAG: hypothetical protein J0H68_01470 [Sphingobacteriia bacterium]|nr:hypothetical protein [Sphingobacteriia bacterium]